MSSYSSLLSSNSSENDPSDDMLFKIDDYLTFNEELQEDYPLAAPTCQQIQSLPKINVVRVDKRENDDSIKNKNVVKNDSTGSGVKVAFRTKSELEIMDDGYKWRKYGKKMVKNSPNPRNYFRCLGEGCNVKKRVERERDDSSYVITTYEGVHNHHPPSSATTDHHAPDSPSHCCSNSS